MVPEVFRSLFDPELVCEWEAKDIHKLLLIAEKRRITTVTIRILLKVESSCCILDDVEEFLRRLDDENKGQDEASAHLTSGGVDEIEFVTRVEATEAALMALVARIKRLLLENVGHKPLAIIRILGGRDRPYGEELRLRERRARRALHCQGLALRKRDFGYMVIDPQSNAVVVGENYSFTLMDVEDWVEQPEEVG